MSPEIHRKTPGCNAPAFFVFVASELKVTAANMYFFVQIRGMVWVAPQSNLGATRRAGGFWHDVGNVSDGQTALGVTVPAAKTCQYAGYVVEGSIAGNGPLFNLQG